MNKITKTISYITVITVVSKLFGFVREMTVAAYYGASWQTDAFNMSNSIIGLSTAILSIGIATVIVPMYNHRLVQKGKAEADNFASNMLCVTSLIYGILAALGVIFASGLIRLFAPDFPGEAAALATKLLKSLFFFTIFTNAVNFLGAVSRSNNRFIVPSLVGFPLSLSVVVFAVFLSKYIGIYAMVLGYITAYVSQLLMIAVSLRKTFKLNPMLNFTNGDVKEVVSLCLPIFVSIGVDQIGVTVDRILASGLSEGSISAIYYAQRLRDLPHGIITVSVITVLFPIFSQYAAKQDLASLKKYVIMSMSGLFALMTPITLVCIYYSKEIIKIAFERGAFTPEKTALTAHIFIFAVMSLFFMGGDAVLNNAFYGMQDTKTPRLCAVVAVGVDIILNLILIRYMQAAGLVLSTSIAAIVNYMTLLIFFRKKYGAFGNFSFFRDIVKCSLATLAMLPIFWVCEFMRGLLPTVVFFCIAVILGLIIYAILICIMRVDIFMFGIQKIKSIFNKH